MHLEMILLRILHIGLGVFWAGTMFFFVVWLEPSVRAIGPAGGPLMAQLKQRGYLSWMPAIAAFTILSGLALYWLVGRGNPAWMSSRFAMTIGLGAASSVAAFVLGVSVMRPTALRVLALGAAAMQAPEGAERERVMAEMGPLRNRLRTVVRWIAVLLAGAVLAMAAARYV
jgi:hypothetical protein